MSVYRYAAYGSNLHPLRLQKRVPSASLIGTCVLSGYDLKFHKISTKDGSGKCSVAAGQQGVYLAIFEIDDAERSDLDRVEGLHYGYNQISFDTTEFGRCDSYIADSGSINDSLQPYDWYKEMVLIGCRANRFPVDYIERIEQVAAVADQNAKRAAENWGIVDELRSMT